MTTEAATEHIMAALAVSELMLLAVRPWIDWCDGHGLSAIACVRGMFMLAFGLGCVAMWALLKGGF